VLSTRRHLIGLIGLIGLLVGLPAIAAPLAYADGDPASDYLISQPTYLSPFDGNVSKSQSDALSALLAEAKTKGFTLKVAVIVTKFDLGAVPVLFGKPQRYARFLGAEDFYFWKDELLVVMPNGFGVSKARHLPPADKALVASLPPPNTDNGDELVAAASRAVIRLAALHGIKLEPVPAASGGSSTTRDRAVIAGAVLVAGLLALALRFGWRRRRGRP
jgi:hypothetical protein